MVYTWRLIKNFEPLTTMSRNNSVGIFSFNLNRIQPNNTFCALCTIRVRCCNLRKTRQISSHQNCHFFFLFWCEVITSATHTRMKIYWSDERKNWIFWFCFINKTRTFSYTFSWQFFVGAHSLALALSFARWYWHTSPLLYFCVARIEFHVYDEVDVWSSFLL